jgi:hypothetical protein
MVGLSVILTGTVHLQFILSCALYFRWDITIVLDIQAAYLKVFTKQVEFIGKELRCSADRSIDTDSLLDCFIMITATSCNYRIIAHSRTHKHSSLYSVTYLSFDKFVWCDIYITRTFFIHCLLKQPTLIGNMVSFSVYVVSSIEFLLLNSSVERNFEKVWNSQACLALSFVFEWCKVA